MTSVADSRFGVDVILRDGGTLRLRPPASAEADALLTFLSGLSERSLFLRFHGFRAVDRELVEPALDPDWSERGALAAWLQRGDHEEVIALATYSRVPGTDAAEIAFAVADSQQGRGIGTRLVEQLASCARARGVTRFLAEVLAANNPALAVFRDAGFALSRSGDRDEVELRFPIATTQTFEGRVDERNHTAVVASLRPFFEPRSVAVIGASGRRGSIGGELFRNILSADFAGTAYPVNLKGEPVAGVRGYATVEEIPDTIDLGVICLPGAQVVEAAEACLRRGIKSLCVISAGFAETGAEGRDRQEQLLAVVRAHGARLVGPNCLGVAVPALGLNATFAPRALPAGRIGFSSQSGALGLALLEKASERGPGFSSFVSIGNKADVSSNDLLEWWEDDESTDLVLLYLESFGNPRAFSRIARRVARRKPILALKAGSTSAGSRAAGSHTAALAGSDAAADALFRQAGVLRARTLEELIDTAALLSNGRLPGGRRVGVVTNAGGLGILCADACEASGLDLPDLDESTHATLLTALPGEASLGNPVDLLGSATAATYETVLGPIIDDPNIDAVIVIFVPPVVAAADDVAAAIRRTADSSASKKPVLAVIISAEGIPKILSTPGSSVVTLPYPESAAKALAHAVAHSEWLSHPEGAQLDVDGIDVEAARDVVANALTAADDTWLDSGAARKLLEAYAVPVVQERTANSVEETVEAARQLGFPVVVKSAVPGLHKTDVGGVLLDLRDEQQVKDAVDRIGLPVLVQPYLTHRTELLAGIVQDPVFGPLVAFGPGGALAELIGAADFRLGPLSDTDALQLVTGGKAGRLVAGFRGAAAADTDALIDLVARLARLAADLPEVAELDLNPVLAGPDGCFAVDSRIRIRRRPESHRLKSW